MTNAERVFEGGRRLSIVISLLLVVGCLVPVGFSAKEVWDDHQSRVFIRESFWEFAEKQTDGVGPWTVFRYEDVWNDVGKPTGDVSDWRRFVEPDDPDELHNHPPTDSLKTDLSELRGRSLKKLAEKSEGPLEFAVSGVLVIFAIRKALGWVVRGFLG